MSRANQSRRAALLAAALLTGAASPTQTLPLAMVQPLPGGIALPDSSAPAGFTPAPVPDLDQNDGSFGKGGRAKVEVTPGLFHQRENPSGDGFTPNSTIFGEQTKHLHPAPSLNLSVPLQ
jgi:hypothetical protein